LLNSCELTCFFISLGACHLLGIQTLSAAQAILVLMHTHCQEEHKRDGCHLMMILIRYELSIANFSMGDFLKMEVDWQFFKKYLITWVSCDIKLTPSGKSKLIFHLKIGGFFPLFGVNLMSGLAHI
jgi:hypothetical protein